MFKRSFVGFASFALVLTALSVAASGQVYITTGKVELLNGDGARVPVSGGTIDVYRTDAKGGVPQAKIGKKGDFAIVGLILNGTYAMSISSPGIKPIVIPNIRAGQEKLVVTVVPGDGRRFTEEEARGQLKLTRDGVAIGGTASGTGDATSEGELTEEAKKKKAEYEAEVKRINEKNEAAKTNFETVSRLLKEGDEANTAGKFDVAIAKFDEGYNVSPEFAGSAPTLLYRLGDSLKSRAVANNNKAVTSASVEERLQQLEVVKKDLGDAMAAFKKSLDILATAKPEEISVDNASRIRSGDLIGMREVMRLAGLIRQVDDRILTIGKEKLADILAADADAAAKTQTKLHYAGLFLATGKTSDSIAAYRDVLASAPDNPDALVGLGLSLVSSGYENTSNDQLQEGANALQRFVSVAPDTHKFKKDAADTLDSLKKLSNVAPQKGASGPKKKP